MATYRHENIMIDLSSSTKSKLYVDDQLVFLGDGYKAIKFMIERAQDKNPVMEKFSAQLSMREKPKFKVAEQPEIEEYASRGNTSRNRTRKK